jgi:hypothetical protein
MSTNYWADIVFVPSTSSPTTSITVVSGTPQTATVSTAFTNALQAKVTDSASNPVAGVTVTFTAPSTGASANIRQQQYSCRDDERIRYCDLSDSNGQRYRR